MPTRSTSDATLSEDEPRMTQINPQAHAEPPLQPALGSVVRAGTQTGSASRWSNFVVWSVVSVLAALSCALTLPSATLKGEYFPVGNDSFYHARRILDTAQDPSAFYQFDPRIHAPEGSLLVWPWGYDYLMAWIVRIGVHAGVSAEAIQILIWIPVAAVLLTIALTLVIVRQLGLGTWMSTLAVLCMALTPTTQMLHAVGQIDHHYAELIFILAALGGGLLWLHNPQRTRYAALLGLTLGMAPAIHNGLFILQAPLVATLLAFWLQRKPMPAKPSMAFAAVLLTATIAILIPSLPFRMGRFEFYTLSWFHLYIAGCTCVAVIVLSRFTASRNVVMALLAGGAALLIPVISQFTVAQSFIAGTPLHLQGIGEMQPPLRIAELFGWQTVTNFYSYLVWIAPLTALVCVIQCWRDRASSRLLFWIASAMGLALLSAQLRLHYFGDFALYMPWLVLLHDFACARPHFGKKIQLLASLALLLLYFPSLRYQLAAPAPRANDLSFENIRPIFDTLRKACAEDPGIVLSDADSGHYIRYYTDCSVIADNFLLTPQQMQKADEVQRLFSLTASEVAQQAPYVKYVLLRPFKIGPGPSGRLRYTFLVLKPRLANDLLLGSDATVPPEYVLKDEIRFPELGNAPYAKLYEIRRRLIEHAR